LNPGKFSCWSVRRESLELGEVVDVHIATGETQASTPSFFGTLGNNEHTGLDQEHEDIIARQPGAACEVQTFK
jgi:hypothetical protein